MARDHASLRDQIGPANDALEADRLRAVTAARVRARLAAERKRSLTTAHKRVRNAYTADVGRVTADSTKSPWSTTGDRIELEGKNF